MICQYCGQHPATVHMKRTINGNTTEHHACDACAREHGLTMFAGKSLTVGNVFEGLFAEPFGHAVKSAELCPVCSKTFRDIVQSGQVGCSQCYVTFYDRLQPTIRRIHGSATHVGKIAESGNAVQKKVKEIEKLKEELSSAVEQQDFERCVELRDRINAMEANENEG